MTVHDLAVLRHPEWFNRWTRTLLAPRRAARRPRRDARDRRLGVHEARARRRCSASPAAKIRVVPNAVEDVFTPDGPDAPRATTCSRSGRSSRARTSRGSPRPSTASCASSARAAGATSSRRRTSTWLGEVDDDGARRALPRRALPRLRLALRGLRHPGRRGARLRLPGRDEPRLARWPSSPATTRRTSTRRTSTSIRDGIARAFRADAAPRSPTWAEVARATRAVYEELA